jgi:hypothetical protein
MNTKTIIHLLYLLDLVPGDYFLFPKLKTELGVISLTQESFNETWDGVARTIAKDDFTAAFRRWKEKYEKCDRIGSGNGKKLPEIKFLF